MKNIFLNYKLAYAFLILFCFTSCKKLKFLDAKPDQSLVVPSTLEDYQAILDNDGSMNGAASGAGLIPTLGEWASDDYYIKSTDYMKLSPLSRKCYIWEKQPFSGEEIVDWDFPYRCAFYANIVLEGLTKLHVDDDQQSVWNNEKGSALFYRAHMFFQLAQVFANPYDEKTAVTTEGIPLRLKSDVNETIKRSSLQETYNLIINDLMEAESLLPRTPLYKSRPSKPAVFALLSRVYLTMKDYKMAGLYADSCLQLYDQLLDFNDLDSTMIFPFPRFNKEVIFTSNLIGKNQELLSLTYSNIDTALLDSYKVNDLRRSIYFKFLFNGIRFRGSYDHSVLLFAGLATDEIYLIRAECYARAGNTNAAMNDLNILLKTRWKAGTFIPFSASDPQDALSQILLERRKELIFRGLRWIDLRRLNDDPRFAKTLMRTVDGQTYSLPPNDLRYVYPIPDNVIKFNKDMPQNTR